MKPADVQCSLCKWYDKINNHGYCHRHAPTPLNRERADEWTLPVVKSDGWCGEFEKDGV